MERDDELRARPLPVGVTLGILSRDTYSWLRDLPTGRGCMRDFAEVGAAGAGSQLALHCGVQKLLEEGVGVPHPKHPSS